MVDAHKIGKDFHMSICFFEVDVLFFFGLLSYHWWMDVVGGLLFPKIFKHSTFHRIHVVYLCEWLILCLVFMYRSIYLFCGSCGSGMFLLSYRIPWGISYPNLNQQFCYHWNVFFIIAFKMFSCWILGTLIHSLCLFEVIFFLRMLPR